MKYKTLTAILICASIKAIGQMPTAPGIPIPQPPQPATLAPQVVISFPNPQPQTANPFAPNANIQRQNKMIMQEVQQHEQRRMQQQQLLAEIERDMNPREVKYEFPDQSQVAGTEFYRQAFDEINQMLKGEKPCNLKRAVFLTENAYYDNRMTYDWFSSDISSNADIIKTYIEQNGYDFNKPTAKKWGLRQFWRTRCS
ncbi:MAG: hypothetical protein KIS77_05835 [Saprospiraceae bacterium]|nr:hypothetical protein [Saprospiraceae bacterium]